MSAPQSIMQRRATAGPLSSVVRRSRTFTAGAVLVSTVVAVAIFAPWIAPHDPIHQSLTEILASPVRASPWHGRAGSRRVEPRDLRRAHRPGDRSRRDLPVALDRRDLGLIAGFVGGLFEAVLMRLVDIVMAFPFYVLIIALVFVLGSGIGSMYAALVAVGWVSYARIVRGETVIARSQDYAIAARQTGLSSPRVLFRHILPNVLTQPIVYAMSDIVNVVLAIVTLGFLGLGVQPPTAEWGSMIADGSGFLTTHWTLATFPAIAVIITGFGFSLVGDGVAEMLEGD